MTSDSMHRLPVELLRILSLTTALLMTAPVSALERDRYEQIDVRADNSDLDSANGLVKLVGNVTITQGSLKVDAEAADVHQNSRSGEIERIVLRGTPARMEQALDNAAGHMRASASEIDYNARQDTIVLTGGVRIMDPRGTLTGERVTYNVAGGNVRAQSGSSEQVRMVFPGRQQPATPENEGDHDNDDGSND